MLPDESPVQAAVRRARMERARARGETHLPEASASDRAPAYVPYGGSGGRGRYALYGGTAETRLLPASAGALERSQLGGSGGASLVQAQGVQLGALQREAESMRRAVHAEVDAVKGRVVGLEERVQDVELACQDAIGRCTSEMAAISTALSARASGLEERDALLGARRANTAAHGVPQSAGARPPPPAFGAKGGSPRFFSPAPLTPLGNGGDGAGEPREGGPSDEDYADARALVRGFARGRVVWHNSWASDFAWYARCNTPLVAAVALHPCSPFSRWQFALIAVGRFGFLAWLVYNGASGRPYGLWINESVSAWTTYRGRWPGELSAEAQLASLPTLFAADRTMIAIHLGVFLALAYQLLLVYLAVPPRFLPTRPELFWLGGLGGVACLGVMISEAAADGANGGVVILLLLYAEAICQLAGLLVDLLGFQVISSIQMRMLLTRQLAQARAREQAGADPELALNAHTATSSGRGALGSPGGAYRGNEEGAGEEEEAGSDGEPLTGPDRAHPSARCCSAASLYARAYPYELRYPRAPYLSASWRVRLADLTDELEAKVAAAATGGAGAAHGRTPETSKAGSKPRRGGLMAMAAQFVLERTEGGRQARGDSGQGHRVGSAAAN